MEARFEARILSLEKRLEEKEGGLVRVRLEEEEKQEEIQAEQVQGGLTANHLTQPGI